MCHQHEPAELFLRPFALPRVFLMSPHLQEVS